MYVCIISSEPTWLYFGFVGLLFTNIMLRLVCFIYSILKTAKF